MLSVWSSCTAATQFTSCALRRTISSTVCIVVMVIARISKSLCVSSVAGSGLMMIVKNLVPLGARQ